MIPILIIITLIIIVITGVWNYVSNTIAEKIVSILCLIILSICFGILINYEISIKSFKSIDINQKQELKLDTLKINIDSVNIKQNKINTQYYPIYIFQKYLH